MYPLVYHLGIDDYFPDEEFEPHLFQHVAAWRRQKRRPSVVRRLASAVTRTIRRAHDRSWETPTARPAPSVSAPPVIRWG